LYKNVSKKLTSKFEATETEEKSVTVTLV